eukprot:scaffold18957_cov102-Skeletonema_dohrnii-CCMP3373.AAC.1
MDIELQDGARPVHRQAYLSNRSKSQWCVTEYVQYLWVLKSRKYVISQQGRYPNYDGWRRSNHHQHVERSTSMGIGSYKHHQSIED